MPSSFHRMYGGAKSELSMVAVIPASLLHQSVNPFRRVGPKVRNVSIISCNTGRHWTVGGKIEVCWNTITQSSQAGIELNGIVVENCYSHHRIDLSEVEVSIPRAHGFQLRIVNVSEHCL